MCGRKSCYGPFTQWPSWQEFAGLPQVFLMILRFCSIQVRYSQCATLVHISHKYLLCNQSTMQHKLRILVVAAQDHTKHLTGHMKVIFYIFVVQTGERRTSCETTAAGSNLFLHNPARSLKLGNLILH